jgi:RNA polymerase sigma-32 factor
MASAILSIAPERNLTRYLQEIRKFAMLTPEEELSLAHRWRDNQDVEAAHKLVTSHLRLVAKIAIGYRGYGLPVGELISEGNVGMVQAAKRFDPERGFRLATYAMWWIRAAIQEYILHSWSLVKMGTTAAQKKLFFNLRRMKGQMQAIDDGDLKPEQVAKIAHMLDVPERDVVSMNRRLAAPDHSLNAPLRQDGDGEWQDWLVDEAETQESAIAEREELSGRKSLLAEALKVLNKRERHIIDERRLKDNPATLEDLSQQYNISRERVRQIEVRAFEKLQKAMKVNTRREEIAKAASIALHPPAADRGSRSDSFMRTQQWSGDRTGDGTAGFGRSMTGHLDAAAAAGDVTVAAPETNMLGAPAAAT